jgi:hypothetical protein
MTSAPRLVRSAKIAWRRALRPALAVGLGPEQRHELIPAHGAAPPLEEQVGEQQHASRLQRHRLAIPTDADPRQQAHVDHAMVSDVIGGMGMDFGGRERPRCREARRAPRDRPARPRDGDARGAGGACRRSATRT